MSKASKAVTLVLIGSAASLIGYNAISRHNRPAYGPDVSEFGDFGPDGEYPDTQPTTGPAGVVPVRSRTYRSSSGTYSSGYHSYGSTSSGYRSGSSGTSSGTYRQPSGGSSSGGSSRSSHSS